MAETKAVNLKVFFKDDARRFNVDESACTSFIFVKEKLLTVFPSLRGTNFKVAWKDSDGDEITISSDEDLITAFTEMSGNTKVLYVTSTQSIPNREDFKFGTTGSQSGANASSHGCPFSNGNAGNGFDLKDMHALGAMARQYLGPLLETLNAPAQSEGVNNTNNSQEGIFIDVLRNAAEGFFGNNLTDQEQQTEKQHHQSTKTSNDQRKASTSSTSSAQQPTTSFTSKDSSQNGNGGSSKSATSDAKIAEGLEQLRQMGFRNDNNFLTHLLECFEGNVASAVKAMSDMKLT